MYLRDAYNAELDAQGYYTMRGKCPRKYFEQKIYGYADYYNPDDDLTRKAGIVAEKCRCQAEEKVQSYLTTNTFRFHGTFDCRSQNLLL